MAKLSFAPRLATKSFAVIQRRMKLDRLMEMPEAELEDLAKRIKASPIFERLSSAGILVATEFPPARFAARRFAGYGERMSGSGLPELMDGNGDLVRLMQAVGD